MQTLWMMVQLENQRSKCGVTVNICTQKYSTCFNQKAFDSTLKLCIDSYDSRYTILSDFYIGKL